MAKNFGKPCVAIIWEQEHTTVYGPYNNWHEAASSTEHLVGPGMVRSLEELHPPLDEDGAETYAGPFCVSPFLVDRAYGGPEEGGWWYECGTPEIGLGLPLPMFVGTRAEAELATKVMQEYLDATVNEGRHEIGSILSTGKYKAVLSEGFPKPYPEKVPHYE